MFNYEKLMQQDPFIYDEITNSLGQHILLIEHPTKGDSVYVICACPELKLAEYSYFYEYGDMTAEHKEYEPSFQNGRLYIGDSAAH